VFVANRQRTWYQSCAEPPVTYYWDFVDDVQNRSGRVAEAGRRFSGCRLALRCQTEATRFGPAMV